jgi:hypothetical protein
LYAVRWWWAWPDGGAGVDIVGSCFAVFFVFGITVRV